MRKGAGGPGGYPGESKNQRDARNADLTGFKLPPQHLRGDIAGAGGQGVAPGQSMDAADFGKDLTGKQGLPALTTPGTKSGPKKGDRD